MAKKFVVITGEPGGNPAAVPSGLQSEGRKLWARILNEWDISDGASLSVLEAACRQADRSAEISEQIKRDGLTVKGRTGPRPHPLLAAELASKSFVARSLQRLGVLFEAVQQPGRPPGA